MALGYPIFLCYVSEYFNGGSSINSNANGILSRCPSVGYCLPNLLLLHPSYFPSPLHQFSCQVWLPYSFFLNLTVIDFLRPLFKSYCVVLWVLSRSEWHKHWKYGNGKNNTKTCKFHWHQAKDKTFLGQNFWVENIF